MTEPSRFPDVVTARNQNEASLFVLAQGGTPRVWEVVDGQLEVRADHPEGPKVYSFVLQKGAPHDPTDFGDGASEILDPAELLFFADRVVRELPAPGAYPRPVVRYLRLAAAAVREARKGIGRKTLEKVDFHSDAAREYALSHADRFSTSALADYAEKLDARGDLWERGVE